MAKTAITPTREQDYPEWYQQVVSGADMAESSPVRGCMVIKPWGYALWENIQQELDKRFKETGHVNAYFPLLIPLAQLEKEAKHVDGFAKECAVVTHHRLTDDGKGGLKPDGKLEEPYVIRPTSETTIGTMYAKWVQSYRDLPILINQWANVMRWEMRTRVFLRTSEFLWQEGHTAHATEAEAREETLKMLDVYCDFAHNFMAMPVLKGEKTISERFPGAVSTYCIEAMMQDGKALQAGTSHFLGQNFAKAYDIQFTAESGELEHAWTTSWGMSTRMIGGLIMTHSDDDGLVLPPRIAPHQVVILPIYKSDEEKQSVLAYCDKLQAALTARVHIDKRDMRGGEKKWHWVKKGVPIRLEVGPRDVAENKVCLSRRDRPANEKAFLPQTEVIETLPSLLEEMQAGLLDKAQRFRDENTKTITSLADFIDYFKKKDSGFAICPALDVPEIEEHLKPLKVSARCILPETIDDTCLFTGKKTTTRIVFAKAY